MKITLNKFLVVTEDETEILSNHKSRWGYFIAYPCDDPTDSMYDTEKGAKAAISHYKGAGKNISPNAHENYKLQYSKVLKVIPITLTIET